MENTAFSETDQSYLKLLPSIVKGASINFIGHAGGIALNALFGLLVARLYGVNITGIFFLAYSIVIFLQFLIKMGLHHAAVRYVSMFINKDKENLRKYLHNIIFINFILSIPIFIITFFVAPLIGDMLNKPNVGLLLRGLSLYLLLNGIYEIMAGATRGTSKMTYNSIIILSDISTRVTSFIVISLLVKTNPIQTIWLSFFIGGIVSLTVSLVFVFKIFGNIFNNFSISIKTITEILRFSYPQGFADMVGNLYQVSPLYLLGYFSTFKDVGLLGTSMKITLLGTIFLIAFNTVFAPYIARLYHSNELKKLEELYKTLSYWIFGSSLFFLMFLVISPVEIMGILGNDFKAGSNVLVILAIGQIVNCMTGSVGFMLTMSGKTKIMLINNFIAFVTTLSLGVLLIPKYGVIGAALSYSISIAFVNLLRSFEVYKVFGFHNFSIRMGKVIFTATLSGLFLTLIRSNINYHNYINFSMSLIAAFLVYLLLFWLVGLAKEDFIIIEATKKNSVRE